MTGTPTQPSVEGSEVSLRPMRWWDIRPVIAIESKAFPKTAWNPETFWAELAGVPSTRAYFVAESAGAVVGYGGVMSVGADADVQTVAVVANAQSKGVGRLLMHRLLGEAKARGCTRMFLEVSADNVEALALYESLGFEVTARRTDYYGPGRHANIMQRTLANNSEQQMQS